MKRAKICWSCSVLDWRTLWKPDCEEVIRRYQAGESVYALADSYGISKVPVERVLRENGVRLRGGVETRFAPGVIPQNKWPGDETEVTNLYRAGASGHDIAIKYGVSSHPVYRILKKTATLRDPHRTALTGDQQRSASEMYQKGFTTPDIGERFGVVPGTVRKFILRMGTRIRPRHTRHDRYPIRDEAFSTTTRHVAYWVGFLMADGCVMDGIRLQLALAARDRAHLEKFKSFLGAGNPISVTTGHLFKSNGRIYQCDDVVRLTISSRTIVTDLSRFGVIHNKTRRTDAGSLRYDRDFWRGCVDGDGTIGIYPDRDRTRPQLSLSGSMVLVNQFRDFCRSIVPQTRACVRPDHSIYRFSLGGSYAFAVIEALYAGCEVALDRKMATAEMVMRSTHAGTGRVSTELRVVPALPEPIAK